MRPKYQLLCFTQYLLQQLRAFLSLNVYFGKHINHVPAQSIIFFPYHPTRLSCGIAGIVSIKKKKNNTVTLDINAIDNRIQSIVANGYSACREGDLPLKAHYLGGQNSLDALLDTVRFLKQDAPFCEIYQHQETQQSLGACIDRLRHAIAAEEKSLSDQMGRIEVTETEVMASRIENLKDIHWCLTSELTDNIGKVKELATRSGVDLSPDSLIIYKKINTVLNSIDRLEVRGRDSAGISLLFILKDDVYQRFEDSLKDAGLHGEYQNRSSLSVLKNKGIHVRKSVKVGENKSVSVTYTYKVAAEIGSLGDNVRFLRDQIQNDPIFHMITTQPHLNHTVLSHTRWASMGAITEANCHPLDNSAISVNGSNPKDKGWIHVCLNGDIDNFLELKSVYEAGHGRIHGDITTDTKIIPLQIETYIHQGHSVDEAFRLAVNDFKGSHAISMHTDLAPGKVFLAQRGSGQAIFVGIAEDHYMASSEVYGFVEETPIYLKLDGDLVVHGNNGYTQGQVFVLDQSSIGGLNGIKALFYDGSPIRFTEKDIKRTEITSRDIDRQEYPHYFLKEISEAPDSVEKTLQNRWRIQENDSHQYLIELDHGVVPDKIRSAFDSNQIQRIYFIGQGTAGVAAQACANMLKYYLNDPSFQIGALKASELSGFNLSDPDSDDDMTDTLIVAISQSGTTTDTNRTVDMVRDRGGHTIAIVNRRDSDITFKADGVLYTSSGRDIEMSVASTKAFYSQIVAGALLGLFIARINNRRDDTFVTEELKQLLLLPSHMREVLSSQSVIEKSAKNLAAKKTYWAAVGSGPNKASADEIRIKLSELCYKTISSDFVEDKKHIDLSAEPLIIVCAAGVRDSVIGDIIKDTAIFRAHKAAPVVIANQGEHRFDPYAVDVFYVPAVDEHLAPILSTLVGHLWGYYAALAINEGSRLLFGFQSEIQTTVDAFNEKGMDVYEIILEESFRAKIAKFYEEFRQIKDHAHFPTCIALASDLTLLLKYLAGRLPVSDFEIDFGLKGTAQNMLNTLFSFMGESINRMARPIDAIKHQAKTVTVGTSRISDKMEGVLYDVLYDYDFSEAQLTPNNIIVLRNLQGIIEKINGSILYRISQLSLMGEPTEDTVIEIIQKRGLLKSLPSRVESDNVLKGTKKIIAREGNVYIGMGRKDGRSILIVPLISNTPSKPNFLEYLLLMNISFKEAVPLSVKSKALGGKFERIKNLVQENSIPWEDRYLDQMDMKELFGISAEKIAEQISTGVSAG